jgi:hypothetical protein
MNMKVSKITGFMTLAVLALALTGCYEEPVVQVHEPGEYLGANDPLLQVAGTPQQQERLAERFKMIQTDR